MRCLCQDSLQDKRVEWVMMSLLSTIEVQAGSGTRNMDPHPPYRPLMDPYRPLMDPL